MAQKHDDDFLRQLAGGELTATQTPANAPWFPERDVKPQDTAESPAAPGEPAEPVLTHPMNGSGPAHDAARRQAPRRAKRAPQDARSVRSRLLAVGALGLGLIMLIALIGGNGKPSVARHTRSSPSTQRADAKPAPSQQTAHAASVGRGAPNGTPAPQHGRLRLVWASAPGATVRAAWRSGGTATVTGRLSTMDGRRVRDGKVSLLAADANRPAQGSRTVGEVRTDTSGAFRVRIAVDRGAPAKLLTFTYLARAQDTVPAAEGHATLDIYAPVTLTAATQHIRRGQAVQLSGSTVPASPVELWAKLPGDTPWRRLASARSARDGSFKATVHVGRDAAQGTYTFQAQVPGSLSYLPGYSSLATLDAR